MSEKKNILSVLALILAVIALAVSAIGLLPRESTPEQPVENPALEQDYFAVVDIFDGLMHPCLS